jgi:hypothetical protein
LVSGLTIQIFIKRIHLRVTDLEGRMEAKKNKNGTGVLLFSPEEPLMQVKREELTQEIGPIDLTVREPIMEEGR